MLLFTVVVAGDGAGADIGARADLSVAEIAKMVGLGATTKTGFLGFDKITHVRALADLAPWTQVCIRPQQRSLRDVALVNDATGTNQDVVGDLRIADHAERPNTAAGADLGPAKNLYERLDDGVGGDLNFRIDHASLRPVDSHACGHQMAAFMCAQLRVERDQLRHSVCA